MKNKLLFYSIYYLLQLTWGIVQNVLGFLLWLVVWLSKPKERSYFFHGAFVTRWFSRDSMSLGIFLFLGTDDPRVVVHEYGHSIQSCILGPFYLPAIGFPSMCWANLPSMKRKRKSGRYRYSDFYTEKWANDLGKRVTGHSSISY